MIRRYRTGCWVAGLLTVSVVVSSAAYAAASDTRLVEAAKQDDKAAVRALLKQGIDVATPQGDGATALHWTAYWDDLETTELLIRAGAPVNVANDEGATALWVACANGSDAMVTRLLSAKADPNLGLPSGETPLMTAARTGNLAAVKTLVAHGADVNAKEHLRGQSALMWAVSQRHPEVTRALIEAGADIRARSKTRQQVLNVGGDGNNALTSANPPEPVDVDLGGYTPLLFAAMQGDLASAKLLVAAGADVNDESPFGTSALVVAAHSGQGAVGRFLLEKGADANAAKAGYVPLHAAILAGDIDLVKALLAHGADPNAPLLKPTPYRRTSMDLRLDKTLVGASPFWLAARYSEPQIMRVLAANGADPLFVKDGATALMIAIASGDRRGRFGAPLTERDEDERRSLEGVQIAAAAGVDINAANTTGDTALHAASRLGFNSLVQWLAEQGARLDVKNKRGETPLKVAGTATLRRGSASSGANDRPAAPAGPNPTADLLRNLGATE
jgi:ankyrin repeat protein